MAIEQHLWKDGNKVANASMSGKQYYAVVVNSSRKWALAGAGARTVGILQNEPAADEACEVVRLGLSKAVLGGTVTCGDPVAVDSAGKIVKALDNDYQVGQCEESGVANEIVTIALTGGMGLTEGTSPA